MIQHQTSADPSSGSSKRSNAAMSEEAVTRFGEDLPPESVQDITTKLYIL